MKFVLAESAVYLSIEEVAIFIMWKHHMSWSRSLKTIVLAFENFEKNKCFD